MAVPPERRRPRRGSLERPISGRIYRAAWLVVAVPLARRRLQRRAAGGVATAAVPALLRPHHRRPVRNRARSRLSRPPPGDDRLESRRRVGHGPLPRLRLHGRAPGVRRERARTRRPALRQPDRNCAPDVRDERAPFARGDRHCRPPGQHRRLSGRQLQRVEHRRPARARPRHGQRRSLAHDRARLDRRRRVRLSGIGGVRPELGFPRPPGGSHRPRRDRGRRRTASPLLRRHASDAGLDTRRHRRGERPEPGPDDPAPPQRSLPADRPRLPVQPLRPVAVHRPGHACRDAQHRGAPHTARGRRHDRRAEPGAHGPAREIGAGPARLARLRRRRRERHRVLRVDRVAAHPRLDDRVRPPRLPASLPCRDDRPLRALPPTTHRPAACTAKPRQPSRALALGGLSSALLLVHRNLPERRVAADRAELGGARPTGLPSPSASSRV